MNDNILNLSSASGETKSLGETKTLKDRRANLEMLRSRIVASKLQDAIGEEHKPPKTLTISEKLAFAFTFGSAPGYSDREWEIYDAFKKKSTEAIADELYRMGLGVLTGELQAKINSSNGTKPIDKSFLEKCAAIIGVSYDDLYAQACEEKKEPKGWAKEEAESKASSSSKSNGKSKKPAKAEARKKAKRA